MLKNLKLMLPTLALVLFGMLTFNPTSTYAQEPTPSASDVISHEKADIELRKTLTRALDTILVKNKIIEAKDAIIATQDTAITQCATTVDGYKRAYEASESSRVKQEKATEMAELAWRASEDRVRELEKSVRKSDGKLKWIAVGAAAAATAIIVLQK